MEELKMHFQPKWKEELVCSCTKGSFSIEFTMGSAHVAILPEEEAWKHRAPSWTHEHWASIRDQLKEWCEYNHASLSIEQNALVFY